MLSGFVSESRPASRRNDRPASLGIRRGGGSFAQKANVDFILKALMSVDDALSGEVRARHLAFDKSRDGPTGWQSEYNLVPIKLGENADVKEVFSAFVEPVEGGGTRLAAVKKNKMGKSKLKQLGTDRSTRTQEGDRGMRRTGARLEPYP
jgi:hypothetical protein